MTEPGFPGLALLVAFAATGTGLVITGVVHLALHGDRRARRTEFIRVSVRASDRAR